MGISIVQVVGILLFVFAFGYWGKGMINRQRGKDFRAFPALILLIVAIGFHFVLPKAATPDLVSFGGKLLDQLSLALMNFGIAMMIDAGYLTYKKFDQPKVYWVPGVLALLLSLCIFLISQTWIKISGGATTQPTTVSALLELGPDDDIEEISQTLKDFHVIQVTRAFPEVSKEEDENLSQYFLVYVDSAYLEGLQNTLRKDTENIDSFEPNTAVSLDDPQGSATTFQSEVAYVANDPYIQNQWFADKLSYNAAFDVLKSATPKRKAKVAILDTGVSQAHEDLSNAFGKSPANEDNHGHGTHCAGLAGAITNNSMGVGSLNWEGKFIEIQGFAALSENGSGSHETIAQAVIDAAKSGVDVISMSLGGPAPLGAPKVMKDAVQFALKKNIIVVVAAGNNNMDARIFAPANVEGVICVSAVDENLRKATFSNTNANVKMPIAAPGVNILSSVPGSKYASFNGTSMACPLVAGLVGIMRSFDPSLTPQAAYQTLNSTGLSLSDSPKVGKLIQPLAVVNQMAKN